MEALVAETRGSRPRAAAPSEIELDPVAFLSGKTTEDLAARFSEGDPLRLIQEAAARIRELSYLLDPGRLAARTSARVARDGPSYRGEPPWEQWIRERLDEDIRELLRMDEEGERVGIPSIEEDYEYIVRTFSIEPSLARTVSAKFNGLPDIVRRRFCVFCLTDASVEDCLAAGLGPPKDLRNSVRHALRMLIDAVWGPFKWKPFEEEKES